VSKKQRDKLAECERRKRKHEGIREHRYNNREKKERCRY